MPDVKICDRKILKLDYEKLKELRGKLLKKGIKQLLKSVKFQCLLQQNETIHTQNNFLFSNIEFIIRI